MLVISKALLLNGVNGKGDAGSSVFCNGDDGKEGGQGLFAFGDMLFRAPVRMKISNNLIVVIYI